MRGALRDLLSRRHRNGMNRYTKVIPELLDDAAAAMDRALGG